jgi:hypothetical protein
MRYRIYIFTFCVLALFLFCGHYGLHSYIKARHLKAEAETLAVRTRLMKRQLGELQQKARILNRVSHFVDNTRKHKMTPENWVRYDVHIQDAMAFQELAQIVEQCIHNQNIYFKPISFHAAVNQQKQSGGDRFDGVEPVPVDADADTEKDTKADVTLALQGTFMVRQ